MPTCAVACCKAADRKIQGIKYYKFPSDIYLRDEWILRCQRPDIFNPDTSRICSRHFTEDSYERDLKAELLNLPPKKLLKENAVPCIHIIRESVRGDKECCDSENRPMKFELQTLSCSACHISQNYTESRERKLTFHPFPKKNKEILIEWKKFANCTPGKDERNMWLCSRHFHPSDFKSLEPKALKDDAVPSLMPPTSSSEVASILMEIATGASLSQHTLPSQHSQSSVEAGEGAMLNSGEADVMKCDKQQNAFEEQPSGIIYIQSDEPWDNDNVPKYAYICIDDSEEATPQNVSQPLKYQQLLERVKTQLCRICGTKQEVLLPIWSEDDDNAADAVTLAKKIEMYLPLQIRTNEELPLNICLMCHNLVQSWHELHVSCLAADSVLRKMFCLQEREINLECQMEEMYFHKDQAEDGWSFTNNSPSGDDMQNDCSDASILVQEDASEVQSECQLEEGKSEGCNEPNENNEGTDELIRVENNAENDSEELSSSMLSEQIDAKSSQEHNGDWVMPTFRCVFCKDTFPMKSMCDEHKIKCALEPGFCEVCGKNISQRSKLRIHLKKHREVKSSVCEKCGKTFCSKSVMLHHMKAKHEGKRIPKHFCEPCLKMFLGGSAFRKHLNLHRKGALQKCLNVKLSVLQLEGGGIVYGCPVCDEAFTDKMSLIIHVNSKKTRCKQCRVYLRNERQLLSHTCRDWVCRYCSKQFTTNVGLLFHERIHIGLKKFLCPTCGAKFISSSQMTRHRVTHEPPSFRCEECGKQFMRKHNYEDHMRNHVGLKYACIVCNKQFITRNALSSHSKKCQLSADK